jgi:hypothetical protein
MTNGGDRGEVVPGRTEDGAGSGPSGATSEDNAGHDVDQEHLHALSAVRAELMRLEEMLCAGHNPVSDATTRVVRAVTNGTARTRDTALHVHIPAWLRVTPGENRWPVAAAIVVAIGLQLALPDRLTLQSRWLLPVLELAMLIGLIRSWPAPASAGSDVMPCTGRGPAVT